MRYSEYSLIQEAIREIDEVINELEDIDDMFYDIDVDGYRDVLDSLDNIYKKSLNIKDILESFDYEENYYKRGI